MCNSEYGTRELKEKRRERERERERESTQFLLHWLKSQVIHICSIVVVFGLFA